MTRFRFTVYAVLGGCAAACHPDAVTNSPVIPKAGVHYVNAVPDTGAMDFVVVDIVSNGSLFSLPFRGMNPYARGIESGSRSIRVFMDGTTPGVASTVMFDQTSSFTTDGEYTFLTYGYARTGQTPAKKILVTTAAPPAVTTGFVHLRVIQLASTLSPLATTPLDAWITARGGAPLSGSPTIANVAFEDVTAYAAVPVRTYRMAFTAAGTTSPVLFQSNLPVGVPPDTSAQGATITNPIAGTAYAGSAITAIVVPQSVSGSKAPAWFTALLPFTSITTTGTTKADTVATAVTPTPHGLSTNDVIVINGAVQGAYNGTKTVNTVVDANTFTYRISGPTAQAAAATGYLFWFRSTFASSFNGNPISFLTSTGTTATVVTQTPHGLATNDIATINGANEAEYNGTFPVTVSNATTFTYTTNGAPAATPATGIPVWRAGDLDYTHPNVVFIIDRRPPNTAP